MDVIEETSMVTTKSKGGEVVVEEPELTASAAATTASATIQASSSPTATVEEEEPRPCRPSATTSSSSRVQVVEETEQPQPHEQQQVAARVLEEEEEEHALPQQRQQQQQRVNNDEGEDDEDEDDYEYEYEDDDAFVSGFIDNPNIAAMKEEKPVKIEEEWREPSRKAVSMSLRAETETTGGKRRLAQDLYRIMNQDTEAAGFDLEPLEDDMGKWRIRVFQFDADSNLAKDMLVLNIPNIELEMTFPDQYPFEPPFVRVVRPRFKKQTGFVMNGALCMELLTKDGWNPINDIESVIVSVRSLLVVGDGRLEAAANLTEKKYNSLLAAAKQAPDSPNKRLRTNAAGDSASTGASSSKKSNADNKIKADVSDGGAYSVSEAKAAYSHLSDYHKKKGWDTSGWWARKG